MEVYTLKLNPYGAILIFLAKLWASKMAKECRTDFKNIIKKTKKNMNENYRENDKSKNLGKWLSCLNIMPYIWIFEVYKYLLLY